MNQSKIEKIKNKIKRHQDGPRFEHTLGVMYTAASLAMCYGADMEKAYLAGLLHDCAKHYSGEKKLDLCKKYGLSISDAERDNPGLLHAKLGSYLAEHKYDIDDLEILDSITWHTTGRPEMTLMDKIVYIADYIEPNRDQAPNLPHFRRLAFEDIDECLFQILEASLAYLKTRNEVIDPMTEQTYLYYKNMKEL